jgi:putative IMPACT (imprinted ancient) family translation regulator
VSFDIARYRRLRRAFSTAALHTEAQRPLVEAGIALCTELAEAYSELWRLEREVKRLRAALGAAFGPEWESSGWALPPEEAAPR